MSAKFIMSFTPPSMDIRAPKGYSYTSPLTIKDKLGGVPLGSDVFTMTVKDENGVVVDTITSGDGIELGGDDGVLLITLKSPVTDEVAVLYYILEWERGSKVAPLLMGAINIFEIWPV